MISGNFVLAIVFMIVVFEETECATCAATLCVQGTICREVAQPCWRPPCPITTQCVPGTYTPPPTSKPGTCPGYQARHLPTCSAQCSSDSSCPGSQKCCFSGCGMKCVSVQQAPVTKPGTCPGYQARHLPTCSAQCSSDSSCPGSQKCCFSGCGMKCVSVQQYPVTKPGTCPSYSTRHFSTCPAQCSSDSSCPGSQKCCYSGCGMRCVSVQQQQTQDKPGTCPRAPYGLVTPCVVGCTSDLSCYGNQKCCSWGCSRQCMAPASTTPSTQGSCPQYPSWSQRGCYRRQDYCQSDYQCQYGYKCCPQPCGKRCMRPMTSGW